MNLLWLVVQEHGAPGAEAPNVFALTGNVMFWTVLIFLVLLVVLLKFAFPPILGYANAREKRIQDTLDESRRQREETERLLEQQRQELNMARAEAQQIIAEGKQAAEKVRQDVLNRARVEHEELLNRAKADIEMERARAIESVRRDAVDIALAAAAKLVEQKLDSDNDRKLVTDFLNRAQTPGARA